MTSLFGHRIRSELLLLLLAECIACFAAVYLLLSAKAASTGIGLLLLAAALALASCLVSGAGGLYQPEVWSRTGRLLLGAAVALVLLLPLAFGALLAFGPARLGQPTWLALLQVLLASFAGVAVIRLAFLAAWQSRLFDRPVVVVRKGAGRDGGRDAAGDRSVPDVLGGEDPAWAAPRSAHRVAFTVAPGASPAEALAAERLRRHRVWAVIADAGQLPSPVERACAARGVKVFSHAEFVEQSLGRLETGQLQDGWLAGARGAGMTAAEAALRRGLDGLAAGLMLLLTLPVMLLAALAIKLDSPGPVFYRQERVGRGGRPFMLLKFRSMVADAEKEGAPQWAARQDPRVTRVGRIMRLTRTDELPQLLNVLRGDMAFVGPRPERPAFVEALGRSIPRYHDRTCVKPGITGWAQVNYPYGASVEDARMKLAYDLYYVKRRSLFLDLLILVATVRVVLFQEGSR